MTTARMWDEGQARRMSTMMTRMDEDKGQGQGQGIKKKTRMRNKDKE